MTDSDIDEGELLELLRLNLVPGIGPRMHRALMDHFGSASAVLGAQRDALRYVPGIGEKLATTIAQSDNHHEAEREFARCRELGIDLLASSSNSYPRSLVEIFDPPNLLYCQGSLEKRDDLGVAMVGSRRCSLYGRQQSERLAASLARAGLTIVSGLARGIDAAAHRGALSVGGRTIAVAATGLAHIYPPEHRELAAEIAASGALVSESPLDQPPKAGLFPQRNRIISGMSWGVIVVEATHNSGALHTARHAMEQGREVMAVPGRIDSPVSAGCHNLIRDGVTLVRHVDDVLEALGPLVEPAPDATGELVHSPRELTLNEQERQILALISIEPIHVEKVLQAAELDPPRVLSTLTVLEMKRVIHRLPGGQLVRAPH